MAHFVIDKDRAFITLWSQLILEAPLAVLQYKVDRKLERVESNPVYDQLKIFIHEAHEGTLYSLLGWLNASNMNGDEIVDFASQMQAELFYSERCLASSA